MAEVARCQGAQGDDRPVGVESAAVGRRQDLGPGPVAFSGQTGQVEPPGGLAGDHRIVAAGRQYEITDHPPPRGGEIDVGHLDGERGAGDGPPARGDVGRRCRAHPAVAVDRDRDRHRLAMRHRHEHRDIAVAGGGRGGRPGREFGPDVVAHRDCATIDAGADPAHAVDPDAGEFGAHLTATHTDRRDDDRVGRRVLVLDQQRLALAVVEHTDPLDDVATRDPHPGLVDRRVVDPTLPNRLLVGGALPLGAGEHAPLDAPGAVEGRDRTLLTDASDRPAEVTDQLPERRVEGRGSAPETIEESHDQSGSISRAAGLRTRPR